MTDIRLGYLCVMLAALFWALSGTTSKFLFQAGLTPLDLVQLRTTVGAAALFFWLAAIRRDLFRIDRSSGLSLILIGALLAAAQFTYLFAISRIHVAIAILLQYQAPAFVALATVALLRKRLTRQIVFALGCSMTGCYLMVGANALSAAPLDIIGVASGLASAVCFAAYTMRSEKETTALAPLTIVFYALLVAALIWNILHPAFSAFAAVATPALWGSALFVCIGGTVIPFGLYTTGIALIGSARGSITATLEPVAAALAAYFCLGERLDSWQIIGGVLVLGAVILLQAPRKE